MKKALFTLAFFSLLAFAASALAPQAFKYQAVVRNAAGQVLANQSVGLRFRLTPADTAMTLYAETQTATTNAFGLVNLNAGQGMVQFGQFDTIHWEQQPIFIQVSLDATGSSNYEIMGFSELLSVPYALYAANVAGGSGLPAGTAGTVLTMGADGKPFWQAPSQLDSLIKVTMTNGDVIYVSPVDNSTGVEWGGYGTNIMALTDITTASAANSDFNGEANTTAIVALVETNGGTAYAAKVCDNLVAYGFDDWYLPAAGELNEMYKKLGPRGSGQITPGFYWSSSEVDANFAWIQEFGNGVQNNFIKRSGLQCRCVRR